MKRNIDLGLLIIRLSIGVLMLLHGLAKFKGLGGIQGMLEGAGLPTFLAYGVIIGEVVAPLAIIVGFKTRIASIVFIVNCLFAIFLAHSDQIFELTKTGGWALELLGLYMFGALALVFTGAGRYSVDKK